MADRRYTKRDSMGRKVQVSQRSTMMHGGSHSRNNGCGPGMMYQNGGCVPASGGMRRGGRTRRRMQQGGHVHNVSSNNMVLASQAATMHTHNNNGFPQYDVSAYNYSPAHMEFETALNNEAGAHVHRTAVSSRRQMRRGGRPTRRMMHGGRNNGASDHHRKSAKRDSMGRK